MVDPVEVYVATLAEVRRQAAQQSRISASVDAGDRSPSGSEASSDWVVLESGTTPAALPTVAGCCVWPQQQWQIAYEILFCQCPSTVARLRPHQADDMLFFVYTDEAAAAARTRLFVRRRQARAAALPPDLRPPGAAAAAGGGEGGSSALGGTPGGGKVAAVDWRASVLLMVVLQTAYRLSLVAAADAELLNALVEGDGPGGAAAAITGGSLDSAAAARVHQVTKVVHASPSRTPVNLDNSRSDAGRPQASYPDICFAVDSCDDAFHSQVLRLPADCYCVLLHADVASSWRLPAAQAASDAVEAAADAAAAGMATLGLSQQPGDAGSGQGPGRTTSRHNSSSSMGGSGASRPHQQPAAQSAVVFSGYVSHQQLAGALGSQLSGDPVQQVLRAAAAAARSPQRAAAQQGDGEQPLATCRVSMRGPGGRGSADVAVSSYPPASDAGHLPSSASEAALPQPAPSISGRSGGGGGRPKLFERAQLLARGVAAAAKQVAVQAAGGQGAGDADPSQLRLKCALMSLQVPVDALADGILQAL